MHAASVGGAEMIRWLDAAGGDLDARKANGLTALMIALFQPL